MGGAVINMSSLLCLPVEDVLIPHILSRLDPLQIWSLRSVCKDFHGITEKYFVACTSVTFRISHSENFGTMCLILSKCQRVHAFAIEIDALLQKQPVDPCLRALSKASPRLRFLALSRCCVTNATVCVSFLSDCCEELEALRLRSLAGQSPDLFLGGISRSCTGVCELELIDQPGIGESLAMVIRSSPCLRRLTVSLAPKTLVYSSLTVMSIFSQLHNTGSGLRTGQLEEAMKDAGCRQLQAVSLRFMGCITDRTIQIMIEFCPHLSWLEVRH